MSDRSLIGQEAQAIRDAITDDGRFAQYVADVKVSARRKSLGMSIKPGDSGITLHVPTDATPDEVVRLISRHRDRLGGLLNKSRECPPNHPVRQLVDGEGFSWLGRPARLRLTDDARLTVERVHDGHGHWMHLSREAAPHGAKPLIDWYIREGNAWLKEETPGWWNRMAPSRPVPSIQVADIGRKRWGVHKASDNSIRIAWQTFQIPAPLVRHVLVHELTHATYPSGPTHGSAFWMVFGRVMPGARQDQRLLAEAGRHVWMGDVRVAA